MKLKQLFTDDDAVSPVIGVILMVAITVILAAVIASFVLGLGQSTGTEKPQASFSIDYTEGKKITDKNNESPQDKSNGGYIEISHDSGDTIKANTLSVKGTDLSLKNGKNGWEAQYSSQDGDTEYGSSSDISSGDSIYINVDSGAWEAKLIWSPLEEDTSKKMVEKKGPEA